jgi:hypothetical protein
MSNLQNIGAYRPISLSSRASFHLIVFYEKTEIKDYCYFTLFKNQERNPIAVTQQYPIELTTSFEHWQERYYVYYFPEMYASAEPISSGSLDFDTIEQEITGDSYQDLTNAEKNLFSIFRRWIAQGNTAIIQETLQDELINGIDIFLGCSPELVKLPWEAWAKSLIPQKAPDDLVRLIRTPFSNDRKTKIDPSDFQKSKKKQRNRILIVVCNDTRNKKLKEGFADLVKKVKKLESADFYVEIFTANEGESPEKIKKDFIDRLTDDRGWQLVIFIGHSEDKNGTFSIMPNLSLSIGDIEENIEVAYQNGLRLVLLCSCRGWKIAESLTQLGLQAIVMKELVHPDKQLEHFLEPLCEQLKQYIDVHNALLFAKKQLYEKRTTSPSTESIPLYYSPLDASPFSLTANGLIAKTKKWLPNKLERVGLGLILFLSLLSPMNEILSEFRYTSQYFYRNLTRQKLELPKGTKPLVTLIEIDPDSLAWATDKYESFQNRPMDRRFLADIVNRLSVPNIKTIGINYDLYNKEEAIEHNEVLKKQLAKSAQVNNTWFFVPVKEGQKNDEFKYTLPAYSALFSGIWQLTLDHCEFPDKECGFSYLLGMDNLINSQLGKLKPRIDKMPNLPDIISQKPELNKIVNHQPSFLEKFAHSLGIHQILDFSISREQIYRKISAKNLLSNKSFDLSKIDSGVVILTNGDYSEAKDSYPLLQVMEIRCPLELEKQELEKRECLKYLMKGVVYAYTVNHITYSLQPQIKNAFPAPLVIPNYLMIGIMVILGKAVSMFLFNLPSQTRKIWLKPLGLVTIGYAIFCLQLYVMPFIPLAVPIVFPVAVFWLYLISPLRSLHHE